MKIGIRSFDEFVNELNEESENLIETNLEDYAGSEGQYGRAYELYIEGFNETDKNEEDIEFYSDVNRYISLIFE